MPLEVHDIKQKIEQQIKYAYMDQFVHKPIIQTEKIWFLREMFNQLQLEKEKIETLIIPCILVEIALDTHDAVKLDASDEEPTVQTQLTVLAGDYYSGLYYYLLSHSKEISLVRVLAGAIKDINELKMDLFNVASIDYVTFMKIHKEINAVLIKKVAKEYHFEADFDYIQRWLMFEKMIREQSLLLNDYESSLYKKWFSHRSNMSIQKYTELLKDDIQNESLFFKNSINEKESQLFFLQNKLNRILQTLDCPETMNEKGEQYEREG